jgi:hypothetical protein
MMMSGSARIIERRPAANVRPAFLLTWTCVRPSSWYSTGSSIVMMFLSTVLSWLSAAYSDVDLPEPVGPVTSTAPCDWLNAFVKRSIACGSMPSCSMLISAFDESRMRITTFSPYCAGSVATRRSIALPSTTVETRPSCGTRRSAMSRSDRILIREVTAGTADTGTIAASWSTPSMR